MESGAALRASRISAFLSIKYWSTGAIFGYLSDCAAAFGTSEPMLITRTKIIVTMTLIIFPSCFSWRRASSRGTLSPPPLALLYDFAHVSGWANLENVAVRQRRVLADELYSMIHVPRLKDENAAELF